MGYLKNIIDKYSNKDELDYYYKLTLNGLFYPEKILIDKYLTKKNTSVLVLGCGYGRESFPLSKLGFKVTGVDINKKMINMGKKLNEKFKTDVKFVNSNVLKFKTREKFDYVLMFFNFIQQLPKNDFIFLLKKLKNITNKDFILILNFINSDYSLKTTLFEFFNNFIKTLNSLFSLDLKIKRIHDYYYLNENERFIHLSLKNFMIYSIENQIKNFKLFLNNIKKSYSTSNIVSVKSKNKSNYVYSFYYTKNYLKKILKKSNLDYDYYLETDFYDYPKILRLIYDNIRIRRYYIIKF